MTEDEAKTKWCPFARVIAPITAPDAEMVWTTGNRVSIPEQLGTISSGDPMNPDAAHCIGSACMAWRWSRPPAGPDTFRSQHIPGVGFCGLAGARA